MKYSNVQVKALHALAAALTGTQHSAPLTVARDEKFKSLIDLTNEELVDGLHYVGEVATCDDCDHWTEIEELNDLGLCSDCEDDTEALD